MKWKEENKPVPKLGDERSVKIFCWKKICLKGECRWFESAYVVQVYSTWTTTRRYIDDIEGGYEDIVTTHYGWKNDRWTYPSEFEAPLDI